jgi:hypothetical protein
MGITVRDKPGYRIRDYWPDNDKNTLYIPENGMKLTDILEHAEEHFGDRYDPAKINIEFKNIHVRCLDYDLYDPFDWEEFTIITLESEN